jgi:hypothetical protein
MFCDVNLEEVDRRVATACLAYETRLSTDQYDYRLNEGAAPPTLAIKAHGTREVQLSVLDSDGWDRGGDELRALFTRGKPKNISVSMIWYCKTGLKSRTGA